MNDVAKIAKQKICKIMANELEVTEDEIRSTFFMNNGSLRLTSFGNKELGKIFDHHVFQGDGELTNLKSSHLISMNRLFVYPYYIGKKNITLYSKEDSVAISLYGSVEDFLDSLVKEGLTKRT